MRAMITLVETRVNARSITRTLPDADAFERFMGLCCRTKAYDEAGRLVGEIEYAPREFQDRRRLWRRVWAADGPTPNMKEGA